MKMKYIVIVWYLIAGAGLICSPYLLYKGLISISELILLDAICLVMILIVRYTENA